MKNIIASIVLAIFGVVGYTVIQANPQLVANIPTTITNIVYSLYVVVVLLVLLLGTNKSKWNPLMVCAAIFVLSGAFFLVMSIMTAFAEGESNWYLPIALGCNTVGMLLVNINNRRNQNKV